MNGTCARCGRDTIVDFRAKRTACEGCNRGPAYCTCAPVQAPVRWVELARRREHGLARELSGAGRAA